jgi:hypothetical protein
MDFQKLLDTLVKEWSTVMQAPIAFLTIAIACFAAAYFVLKWRYDSIIEQLREQMETLKQRLLQKTEQAEQYKERALKFDEKVSEVVSSDIPELCARTLSFVSRLRDFISRRKLQGERDLRRDLFEPNQKSWNESTDKMMQDSFETADEWGRSFKVDAMLLRDELYSRLNKNIEDGFIKHTYEHPTNFFGYEEIATDLESHAKILQSQGRGAR